MQSTTQTASHISHQLLQSVSDQLKLPWLQIANEIELGLQGVQPDLTKLQAIIENAIFLIEAYNLSLRLAQEQGNYELVTESVSLASILYDALTESQNVARLYNVQLELNISGKNWPVNAHKRGLVAVFVGLASALIELLPAQKEITQPRLQFASHNCRYGLVAGIYTTLPNLSREVLLKGRSLNGFTKQPMVELSQSNASGLFVADAILSAMHLNLHVSRHNKLYGLGVILKPSAQLSLV